MITQPYLDLLAQNVEHRQRMTLQFRIIFYVRGGTKLNNEPKLKKGGRAECYNGVTHDIIEVSNTFEEVAEYDSNGACSADLEKYNAFDDAIFVAVKNLSDGQSYVFCCSRDSEILGD